MRKRIIDGLYVGNLKDCETVGNEFAVVHACKNPCHANRHGAKPDPKGPHYLSERVLIDTSPHLFLNMIDPPTPLFRRESFDAFLEFTRVVWETGKPLLIHCNKGESRAPSLALVFLAKVLHRITDASFDEAWDDFEALAGEKYTPGAGIETFLRENWKDIAKRQKLPSTNQPGPAGGERIAPAPVDVRIPTSSEECAQLVRGQPLIHFSAFVKIEGKQHEWITPVPNLLQFDLAEAYTWLTAEGVPVRLLALKPRQVGCSTFVAELCYHHMRRVPSNMLVMGDVSKRTEKVYSMFNGYSEHDSYPWDSTYTYHTEKGTFTYPDGSKGLVEHDTALDPKAGISATRQILWLTEAARYQKTGQRTDKKVVTAVLNSLANVPNSLGIAETTAEGAGGWFYETWQSAVTLEDRKKGVIGNGWVKVFAAWFHFPEHRLPRAKENVDYFSDEVDHRERRGIQLYGWTPEQIAWRRMKIAKDCAGDPRMFDQDFPEDPESCFLASGRPRFDQEALVQYERAAKQFVPERGTLERQKDNGGVQFFPRKDGEAWLWMSERPTYGLAYVGFVDPCTGEQSEGSEFPDAHAAGIIRSGYFDDAKVWHAPKLVAAIDVPTGCRWDDATLAERMKRLLDFYGECPVVPETGNGLGVISELRHVGATIYAREKMDAIRPGQKALVVGWETNKDTRPLWVNAVADAIRERAFECAFQPAISEMRTFMINDRGKAEAKSGCHDDWVAGIGIGLFNLDYASTFMPPPPFLPESSIGPSGDSPLGASALS